MTLSQQIQINGSKADVWEVVTNIENAAETIGGIESIEILEKPTQGLVGLKWKEARKIFGKTSTETMWITEAVEHEYYKAAANSHGSKYLSTISINEENEKCTLKMTFEATPQSFGAKVMSGIMSKMLKKSMAKLITQDLEDLKKVVESK